LEENIASIFRVEYVPPKRRLTFNGIHGIVAQEIVMFIATAVRTSNPTTLKRNCPKSHFVDNP
jgi:hypothetical protein